MSVVDQDCIHWIEKQFSFDSSFKDVNDLLNTELSETPEFLYQLARVNSEAAFLLWQLQRQKKLYLMIKKDLGPVQIVTTTLFPLLNEKQLLVVKKNKAHLLTLDHSAIRAIEKPLAFRKWQWREVGDCSSCVSLDESFEGLKDEVQSVATIVAGIKYKAYTLAHSYAEKRIQGGRAIKDWTSIQEILGQLYLSIKTDEVLISKMDATSAFSILLNADSFASMSVQVFGGAGYMEDYSVERLFRECLFLKNWPLPYKQELIKHYQAEQ